MSDNKNLPPSTAPAPQTDDLRKLVNAHCNDLLDCAAILHDDGRFKRTAEEIRTAVAELRAAMKAAPAPQTDEILALHRQLAAEKLRANQGWERAEAKSKECIDLRERMAAQAAPSAPTDSEIDALWREATAGNHGDTTQAFVRWFARELLASKAAPSAPTDLSKRLCERAAVERDMGNSPMAKLLSDAADEIERHYGGMMAWKSAAIEKDAEIVALRHDLFEAERAPTDSKLCGLWELANRIEEANEHPIAIAKRASSAIKKLLSIASKAAHGAPIGHVVVWNKGGSGEHKSLEPIGKSGCNLAESLPEGALVYLAVPSAKAEADNRTSSDKGAAK